MLKWLLPAKVGKFRLYSELFLVVYLDNFQINAVLIKIGKNAFKVEKFFQKFFESIDATLNRRLYFDKEKLREVFEELFKEIPVFDQMHLLVSAELIIFKQITMPFSDPEKISKLLPFEIESYIAVNSGEVSLDFLPIESLPDGQTKVIAAAIRDADLSKLVPFFKSFNTQVYKIGVDAFVLYELLKQIPSNCEPDKLTCFLELGEKSLMFGFVENLSLQNVRVFEFGIFDVVKSIAKRLGLTSEEVFKKLSEIGVMSLSDNFSKTAKEELLIFFKEVIFVLDVYVMGSSFGNKLGKLVIFDKVLCIKNFDEFCAEALQMPTQYFATNNWLELSKIKFHRSISIDQMPIVLKLLGFLSLKSLDDFSLSSKLFPHPDRNIVSKQIFFSMGLAFFTMLYLLFSGFSQTSYLSSLALKKEAEVVSKLQKILPAEGKNQKKVTLKKLLASVTEYLAKRKTVQSQSGYGVPDFLANLFEVTRLIDRTRFGVTINNLTIKQDSDFSFKMSLQGNFDQSKSVSEVDNFTSFLRVLKLSRRLSLLEDVKYDGDEKAASINFSLVLGGLDSNENNG